MVDSSMNLPKLMDLYAVAPPKPVEDKEEAKHWRIRHHVSRNDKEGFLMSKTYRSRQKAVAMAKKFNEHPRIADGEKYKVEECKGEFKEPN